MGKKPRRQGFIGIVRGCSGEWPALGDRSELYETEYNSIPEFEDARGRDVG